MSENKKKKKTVPLKNNYLVTKSKNLTLSKANDEELKSRTSSMLSGKSFSKYNFSILKIMNDSKIFETMENKLCRICFEKESKKNPLISPCLCEGSIKYVHQSCLKNWINISKIKPELSKCEICNFKYNIRFFKDKKFNKVAFGKFILYLFSFFIGMNFIVSIFIYCFYHFALDNDKVNKKTKKLFLIISFGVSLFIILVICIFIYFCSYNKCSIITFDNYEILTRNLKEIID